MQKDPVVTRCAELLRLGVMPTPEEIRAGKVRTPGSQFWSKKFADENRRLHIGPVIRQYHDETDSYV